MTRINRDTRMSSSIKGSKCELINPWRQTPQHGLHGTLTHDINVYVEPRERTIGPRLSWVILVNLDAIIQIVVYEMITYGYTQVINFISGVFKTPPEAISW